MKIIGKSPHSWTKKSLFTVTHALFFMYLIRFVQIFHQICFFFLATILHMYLLSCGKYIYTPVFKAICFHLWCLWNIKLQTCCMWKFFFHSVFMVSGASSWLHACGKENVILCNHLFSISLKRIRNIFLQYWSSFIFHFLLVCCFWNDNSVRVSGLHGYDIVYKNNWLVKHFSINQLII